MLKKKLSTEEIEAQSVLELPDREVLDSFTGPFTIANIAAAANFCPATTFNASNSFAVSNCTAVAIAAQNIH